MGSNPARCATHLCGQFSSKDRSWKCPDTGAGFALEIVVFRPWSTPRFNEFRGLSHQSLEAFGHPLSSEGGVSKWDRRSLLLFQYTDNLRNERLFALWETYESQERSLGPTVRKLVDLARV